ncbi:MAG: nitroreductase [Hyphomicrobiaceae bacterium]|nr:nitroreductase [Hyphomicrobiaceae bacterium]
MNIKDAIIGRQSIRAFLPEKKISREIVHGILNIARRAPSGSNIQPWKVYVITGEKKVALSKACIARHNAGDQSDREYNYYPTTWRSPYLERRRECGWGLYASLDIKKDDKVAMNNQHGRNYTFFDAPVGLFITLDRELQLGSWLDTGMFIQSIMLAARHYGLETCPQAAFCNFFDTVIEHIGAPKNEILITGIALGYPDPKAKVNTYRTTRIDVNEFTTYV